MRLAFTTRTGDPNAQSCCLLPCQRPLPVSLPAAAGPRPAPPMPTVLPRARSSRLDPRDHRRHGFVHPPHQLGVALARDHDRCGLHREERAQQHRGRDQDGFRRQLRHLVAGVQRRDGGRRGRRRAARPVGRRDAGAGRRPSHGQLSARRRRPAAIRRHRLAAHGDRRPGGSVEGRRIGHLWLRCHRGRGQRHPEEAIHRARRVGDRRVHRPRRRPVAALRRDLGHRATSRPTDTTST